MLERFQERVLRGIFRVRFIPQNRECDDEDAPLVRPNQFIKQLLVRRLNRRGVVNEKVIR
jgi:hypothetical protein